MQILAERIFEEVEIGQFELAKNTLNGRVNPLSEFGECLLLMIANFLWDQQVCLSY